MTEAKAYRERAQLVAFVASLFPSVIAYSDPSPEWPVIYVTSPAGQLSWHLSKDDLELFGHVPVVHPDDSHAQWDGHSTEEKYRRLAALVSIRQLAADVDQAEPAAPLCFICREREGTYENYMGQMFCGSCGEGERIAGDVAAVDQLAAAIAARLHQSILQIPADVADALKPWHGFLTHTRVCGGDWPLALQTRITADGGIWLQLQTADGQRVLERVLHP